MRVLFVLTVVLSMAFAEVSHGSDPPEGTMAGQLPALAEADTVRTNLWLTEALMGEIVSQAAAFIPPAPGAVLVVCSLTRWPVPWPFASSMKWRSKRMMPKPLPEADAPWSGVREEPRS